eukprot:6213314-Pleurochrysis_carterae.AAC.3
MQQLLGMIALREQRALNVPGRGSSQLAAFGQLKAEHIKLRSSVSKAFKGIVPDSHSFTWLRDCFPQSAAGRVPAFLQNQM